MLFLAPRLRTRPSALWSRFSPAAPSSPPKQHGEVGESWRSDLSYYHCDLCRRRMRISVYPRDHKAVLIASQSAQTEPPCSWTEVSAPLRLLRSVFLDLPSQAAERTAPKRRDTWIPDEQQKDSYYYLLKTRILTHKVYLAKSRPTFFPESPGQWCGCWSCDCELHSAHSSLAPPLLRQQLSHSNQPSRCQMKCCSCSPDKKRNRDK